MKAASSWFTAPRCESAGSENIVGAVVDSLISAVSTTADERIVIVGASLTGKSIVIDRIFLELVDPSMHSSSTGSRRAVARLRLPVPMWASAHNLRDEKKITDELQTGEANAVVFVRRWLQIRRPKLQIPADLEESLVESIVMSLKNGDVVLVLDGYDALDQSGLRKFVNGVLQDVKRWVVSTSKLVIPPYKTKEIHLESWTVAQARDYIGLRLSTGRMKAAGECLANALTELESRHERAWLRGDTEDKEYWLLQPGNLAWFITDMETERLTDDKEIRKRAASQSYLFKQILDNAVRRVGADASAVQRCLFDLASSSDAPGAPASSDKSCDQLSEIVDSSRQERRFRHEALREFFRAGRIAEEILEPVVATEPLGQLVKAERWDSRTREFVDAWLEALDSRERFTTRLRRLLARDGKRELPCNPQMRRNLVDLLVGIERARSAGHLPELHDLDLSGLEGDGVDLRGLRLTRCTFERARLEDADLTGSILEKCTFERADLSGADAVGTAFSSCSFGEQAPAVVNGMAIKGATFDKGQRGVLEARGAVAERSRYRGAFGEHWDDFQRHALGEGLVELQDKVYRPAIVEALQNCQGEAPHHPIYLVDLMAGGKYAGVTGLLKDEARFKNLHILGIDKDPTKLRHDRLEWKTRRLDDATRTSDPLGLDIFEALPKSWPDAFPVHVIVGKKGLHEIRRELQPEVLQVCARSLRPGGRLILFVDTPGPLDFETTPRADLDIVHRQLENLRRVLVNPECTLDHVREALEHHTFDATPAGQLGFGNTWVMLKDWANNNRHECASRYFASVAEIREWARNAGFESSEPQSRFYTLNPLAFNELGIGRVLDRLDRAKASGVDLNAHVSQHARLMRSLIASNERLPVLSEFCARHFEGPHAADFAKELEATKAAVDLATLHESLGQLNTGEDAWSFKLRCAVLEFEKAAVDTRIVTAHAEHRPSSGEVGVS